MRDLPGVVGRLAGESHGGDALRLLLQAVLVGRVEPDAVHRVDAGRSGGSDDAAARIEQRIPAAVGADLGAEIGGAEEQARSEEHTSEIQSPKRITYAVLCLNKKQT